VKVDISRRQAIVGLTGSLIAIAVVNANGSAAAEFILAPPGSGSPFMSQKWAESADDPRVAAGADLASLRDRISTFFGPATGMYLAEQVIDINTASPGWDTKERLVYDQFVTIFRGAPEFEGVLPSGVRMVVRFMSTYKAVLFLDSNKNILSAALTFEFCPPDGVDQTVAEGRVIHTPCLWPFSAVLFFKTPNPDPSIVAALQCYLHSLPMELERSDAARMTPDGKIRIKILGRKL
jgi:hypothetical protein